MDELSRTIYINQIRDKLVYVHEKFRTNTKYRNNKEYSIMYERLDKALEMLGNLAFDYARVYEGTREIILLEDLKLYPGESREVLTTITGLHVEGEYSIEFSGYIPSDSYLQFSFENTEEGLKVHARNISMLDTNDTHSGYHFHNPITIDYFKPGVMELFRNSKIGLFVTDYIQEDEIQRVRKEL